MSRKTENPNPMLIDKFMENFRFTDKNEQTRSIFDTTKNLFNDQLE